jgi:hypothetical protein
MKNRVSFLQGLHLRVTSGLYKDMKPNINKSDIQNVGVVEQTVIRAAVGTCIYKYTSVHIITVLKILSPLCTRGLVFRINIFFVFNFISFLKIVAYEVTTLFMCVCLPFKYLTRGPIFMKFGMMLYNRRTLQLCSV